jgi:hypothetical protein
MNISIAGCPKPLSRKKLRQLMPHNHADLTGPKLAGRYGRSPGTGRYKTHLRNEEERLERQQQRLANNESFAGAIATALLSIRKLLMPRFKARRVIKAA